MSLILGSRWYRTFRGVLVRYEGDIGVEYGNRGVKDTRPEGPENEEFVRFV